MKRIVKAILITAGVVVILAVAAVFGLNMYAQSPEARARLQDQISHALGVPVEITNIAVGWGGAKISGVRIPSEGHPLLEADSFSADYALLPLLQKKFQIHQVTLDSPKIVWAQNADGEWVLPALPEKGNAVLPNAPAPKEKTNAAPAKNEGYAVVVEKLVLRGGSLELLDDQQHPVLAASNVEMEYNVHSPEEVDGRFNAAELKWADSVSFTDVHSPIVLKDGVLNLTDLQGACASGTVEGQGSIKVQERGAPYTVNIKLAGVNLAKLAPELGWAPEETSGLLGGSAELHGAFGKKNHPAGKGQFLMTDVRFPQFELFQTIGQVLQIPELTNIQIKNGEADFHFADQKTTIETLRLETQDLKFTTKGTIKGDGKVNCDAQLAVSQRLAQGLPSLVRTNFTAPDTDGWQSINFDITGKTDRLKTNLYNRIIGEKITNQVGDVLSDLFGGAKTEGKKEKKERRKVDEENSKADLTPAPRSTPPPALVMPEPASRPPAQTAPTTTPAPKAPGEP